MIFFSVLFNPDLNAIRNIRLAIDNGFKVVVYVNKVSDVFLAEIKNNPCVILGDNTNVGLGAAFYEFEKYLSTKEDRYYVYFDQDTIVNNEAWEIIYNTAQNFFLDNEIGMIFYGNKSNEYSDLVVSSGCLFSMDVIDRVGRHSKNYFVEGVDYEFCLRLRNKKLKIKNIYVEAIDHNSLQDNSEIKIFGYKFFLRKYGNRLKDFNASHRRLIFSSLMSADFYMALIFIKSLVAFNIKEHVARLFLRGH